MDLSAYINSGVLELYVLDRLSPDERRRVEQYASQYPEVRTEIEGIEVALEKYAVMWGENTPPAPAALTNVLQRIKTTTPAAEPRPKVEKVITQGPNYLPWILALLLLLAVAGLAYFYLQNQQRTGEVEELQNSLTELSADCERLADDYEADQQQLAVLTDIDTRGIILGGSENAPDSRAIVFYNDTDGDVLFSASNLPPPPAGKQYQLWAIDAEGPKDLGVLDLNLGAGEILTVPYHPAAAAFAITLEDEGGQPAPDLTQLQVIGEVGP